MIALRKPVSTVVEPAPLSPAKARDFFAFAEDESTASIIRAVTGTRGLDEEAIVVGSLDDAVDGLANIRTPKTLIVDLGPSRDIMGEAERLAQVCDPDARVILLGAVNDLHLYRDLIAAGVADYIVKPFDERALEVVLDRIKPRERVVETTAQDKPTKAADVVAVIGARGGVGASTIAVNLAWNASATFEKSVVLVDMDLTFGTQALNLDVDPGAGLADAMQEPGRMDELFVKRASIAINDRLCVMAAETDIKHGDIASAEAFSGLLEFVAPTCDIVIADVPRHVVVSQPEIINACHRIVLIAEPGLATMRDTARLAAVIKETNPAANVRVVMNRQGVSPKSELSRKAFEEGSGLKIDAAIPFDPQTAMSAEAEGKCLMQSAPGSKIGKGIAALGVEALGLKPVASKTSLFGKLRLGKGATKDEARA